MQITRDSETCHTYFNQWSEFVHEAKKEGSDPQRRASSRIEGSWYGTDSFGQAMYIAEHGWVEGAKLIKDRMAVMTADLPVKTTVKELAYSQAGPGMLNMGRYIMGHPQPYQVWRETEHMTPTSGKGVVKVVFNGTVSSNVSQDIIRDKGVLTCSILDTLEHLGYRTELTVVFSLAEARRKRNRLSVSNTLEVVVKNASDWMDMDKIAFACAHPSSLRRIAFSVWEQQPAILLKRYDIGYTFSSPARINVEKGVVYIPEIRSDSASSKEAQQALIRASLESAGISFE
jgi:hypothetical protein